jgi:hypothetical protein
LIKVPPGSINYKHTNTKDKQHHQHGNSVLVRYNLNNFIGIGAGIQGNINASESMEQTTRVDLYENDKPTTLLTTTEDAIATSNSFTNFKAGLFDLTVGAARSVVQVQECDMW